MCSRNAQGRKLSWKVGTGPIIHFWSNLGLEKIENSRRIQLLSLALQQPDRFICNRSYIRVLIEFWSEF